MTIPKAEEVLEAWRQNDTTQKELADQFNTNAPAISIILRSHRAEGTGKSPASSEAKPWRDREELHRLYHEEELTQSEMGEVLGVSEVTVRSWMKKKSIERCSGRRSNRPYTSEDWLRTQYVEKEQSCHQIAQKCGVINDTIRKWLIKFDIPRRQPGNAVIKE